MDVDTTLCDVYYLRQFPPVHMVDFSYNLTLKYVEQITWIPAKSSYDGRERPTIICTLYKNDINANT